MTLFDKSRWVSLALATLATAGTLGGLAEIARTNHAAVLAVQSRGVQLAVAPACNTGHTVSVQV